MTVPGGLMGLLYPGMSVAPSGFPIVVTTNSGTHISTTSHVISMPSGITAGDLLWVWNVHSTALITMTWSGSWLPIFSVNGNGFRLEGGWLKAVGSDTLTITSSFNTSSAHISYRINNMKDPAIIPPVASSGATAASGTPDPDIITPVWGLAKDLFIASGVSSGGAITAAPTNYTNLIALTLLGNGMGSAQRAFESIFDNPGTFSGTSGGWVAGTVAIPPSTLTKTSTDTGWVFVGLGADDASIGTTAWSNPTNIYANDGANATNGSLAAVTHYLKGTTLGLSVPTGATIDGIEVRAEARSINTGATTITSVKLVKGGTISGNNNAGGEAVTTTATLFPYGGATDLWGLTWTAADVNASNFGFVLSMTRSSIDQDSVDYFQVKVYYTTYA